MRWQMSLYKEMAGKAEDAEDPEKVVKRVQEVSAVLYHIEVVGGCLLGVALVCSHLLSGTFQMCALVVIGVFFFVFFMVQTEHPFKSKKMVWHKLLSKQRRRAVVACFRMTPLYNIIT